MSVFFFKQKTAYEMRISDWSSDVCSSDLAKPVPSQSIPATLERVLAALDALKPTGWLAMDNALRDLDGDARDRISYLISDLEPTLREKTQRRFMMATEEPIQVWL